MVEAGKPSARVNGRLCLSPTQFEHAEADEGQRGGSESDPYGDLEDSSGWPARRRASRFVARSSSAPAAGPGRTA